MRSTSTRKSPLAILAAFALGACTTVALQSSANDVDSTSASASTNHANADEIVEPETAATVVALDDAPRANAPNGKATITHLARGQNAYLGHLRMDGDGAVPVHRDATEEFIHILSGSGTITIDGQAHEVAAGATIYMPANAEVSYKNGAQEMVALQVFAGPEPAAKYEAWTPVE